jgi:hypothetical protein
MRKQLFIGGVAVSLVITGCITINVPETEINLPTSLPNVEDIGEVVETAIPRILDEIQDLEITFEGDTYIDEEAGFELQIPEGWYEGAVETLENGYSTTFQSWPILSGNVVGQSSGGTDVPSDNDADGEPDSTATSQPNGTATSEPVSTSTGEPDSEGDGQELPPANGSQLIVEVLAWEPANNLNAYRDHWLQVWESEGKVVADQQVWNINQKRWAVFYMVRDAEGEVTFYFITGLRDKYLVLTGYGDLNVLIQIARSTRIKDN